MAMVKYNQYFQCSSANVNAVWHSKYGNLTGFNVLMYIFRIQEIKKSLFTNGSIWEELLFSIP